MPTLTKEEIELLNGLLPGWKKQYQIRKRYLSNGLQFYIEISDHKQYMWDSFIRNNKCGLFQDFKHLEEYDIKDLLNGVQETLF